jgi:hypothetical protein
MSGGSIRLRDLIRIQRPVWPGGNEARVRRNEIDDAAVIKGYGGMNQANRSSAPTLLADMLAPRRVILLSLLCSVLCLAYFQLLDRLFFSSRHFSVIFRLLLTGYDAETASLAAGVCVLAALWNRPNFIVKLVDFLACRPFGLATVSTVLIVLGSIFVYHQYPLCMDEYAAVFQSKIFASGHLYAQLPPSAIKWLIYPEFNGTFLIASQETGRAVEEYWPGYALLLAPFELFNVPWLCNALLAGLAIYLIFRITIDITGDRRAAGWAMLCGIASGAFLANAISFYSMQAHLTANLLLVWLLLRPTIGRCLAAGLVGSLALILHNPFPHTLFALPWVIALALNKDTRRYLIPLILGYLPIMLGVGVGWFMFRNSIAAASHGPQTAGGLANGAFKWPDAAILNMRAAALAKMWLWAVPGIYVLAVLGYVRHRGNRHASLLAQSAVLTFAGYLFVNLDQGHGWGYRYFHSAWGVVPVLAGCAMTGKSAASLRLASFVGSACLLSLLLMVPFQMHQIEHFVSRHLDQLPPPKRPGSNVYFVNPAGGSYMADMIQMDPQLRTPDLLLVRHGADADAEFVRRNWPNATKTGDGKWGEQWYVGPANQRGAPASIDGAWAPLFP